MHQASQSQTFVKAKQPSHKPPRTLPFQVAKQRKAIKVACLFHKRLNYYQYDSLHTPHFKIKGGMLKEMVFFLRLRSTF